jgi:hypothetical protein
VRAVFNQNPMIILEKPYVSEFLQLTVVQFQIPVLASEFSKSLKYANEMNLVENDAFFKALKKVINPLLYSNSENSVELLNRYCPELPVTKNVNFFKDKSKLREIFSRLNPDVWHHKLTLKELDDLDISTLQKFIMIPNGKRHLKASKKK